MDPSRPFLAPKMNPEPPAGRYRGPDQTTYRGFIKTPHDAMLVFEACRLGLLHMVTRRLTDAERNANIVSGSVFVWDEEETGIRRWTDGKTWSSSRIFGAFLQYKQVETRPSHMGSGRTELIDVDHGLVKRSISITMPGGATKRHLISYFRRSDIHRLSTPSQDARLMHIVLPAECYLLFKGANSSSKDTTSHGPLSATLSDHESLSSLSPGEHRSPHPDSFIPDPRNAPISNQITFPTYVTSRKLSDAKQAVQTTSKQLQRSSMQRTSLPSNLPLPIRTFNAPDRSFRGSPLNVNVHAHPTEAPWSSAPTHHLERKITYAAPPSSAPVKTFDLHIHSASVLSPHSLTTAHPNHQGHASPRVHLNHQIHPQLSSQTQQPYILSSSPTDYTHPSRPSAHPYRHHPYLPSEPRKQEPKLHVIKTEPQPSTMNASFQMPNLPSISLTNSDPPKIPSFDTLLTQKPMSLASTSLPSPHQPI